MKKKKKKAKPRKVKEYNKSDYIKMEPKHRLIYAIIGASINVIGIILLLVNIIIVLHLLYFILFSLFFFIVAIVGLTPKKKRTMKEVACDTVIENVISTTIDQII